MWHPELVQVVSHARHGRVHGSDGRVEMPSRRPGREDVPKSIELQDSDQKWERVPFPWTERRRLMLVPDDDGIGDLRREADDARQIGGPAIGVVARQLDTSCRIEFNPAAALHELGLEVPLHV